MHVANVAGQVLGGNFLIDSIEGLPNNDYLRLRVCVYLDEPLVPGFFLDCGEGQVLWVQFKYEEVFKYCVKCGKIGHKATICREEKEDVCANVCSALKRVHERGFMAIQATANYTMFNLDLRALRVTTHYTTFKVRLGTHPGVRAQAEYFNERVNVYNIHTKPEGRVRQGMTFNINDIPFACPIVFQGNVQGHEAGMGDHNMTNTGGGLEANAGEPDQGNPTEMLGNEMEIDA